MATEPDTQNPTSMVRITNNTPGPRYVHAVGGPVTIAPGATSDELEIRDVELTDLPEGMVLAKDGADGDSGDTGAVGVRTIDTGGPAEGVDGSGAVGGEGEGDEGQLGEIPDDLASTRSADGIVGMDKLREVADGEGVTYENDANKPTIVAAIVAKRNATAS